MERLFCDFMSFNETKLNASNFVEENAFVGNYGTNEIHEN